MKQEMMVKLAARFDAPATSIYIKRYTQADFTGQRDVMILVCQEGLAMTIPLMMRWIIPLRKPYFLMWILFDPRGCGASEKSSVQYCTLAHYIDDIESIRAYFKIPSHQFILFGQSYGSIVALGYAVKYPATLKKLILMGGAASSEFLTEAKENLQKIGTPEQKEFGKKIWTGSFTGAPQEVAEYYEIMGPLYAYSFKPGQPTPSLTYNVDVLNLGFRQFLKAFDYRPQLSRITCPTLILWGEDDWISDKRQAAILHAGIPDSELVIYQHCSHLLWIDQWERFVQKMIKFLQGKSNVVE